MPHSRSPQRGSSRRHSDRSRSPQRHRNYDSSSRRSRSPRRDRGPSHNDRRRSPSPSGSRRSGWRDYDRHNSSDSARDIERGRYADDRSSRGDRARDTSPSRGHRSSHDDRRDHAADSQDKERRPSSSGSRLRESRWESEPVVLSAVASVSGPPCPPAAASVVLCPAPPPQPEKAPQAAPLFAAAAAETSDVADAGRAFVLNTQPITAFASLPPAQMTRIYVGNVYRELSEAEIQTVFEAFGPVRSCKFIANPENGVGKHKGFGFIEYVDPAAAASAVQAMNGFTLALLVQGRAVKVGWAHSAANSSSLNVDLQQVAAIAAAAASALVNKQAGQR